MSDEPTEAELTAYRAGRPAGCECKPYGVAMDCELCWLAPPPPPPPRKKGLSMVARGARVAMAKRQAINSGALVRVIGPSWANQNVGGHRYGRKLTDGS